MVVQSNRTMEERVMILKYQAYTFPNGKQNKMYMTKFVLVGSQRGWSMITQIIEGMDGISHHEFNRHLENVQMLMRNTTHQVERFRRMSSNSDDIEKRDGEQRAFWVLG